MSRAGQSYGRAVTIALVLAATLLAALVFREQLTLWLTGGPSPAASVPGHEADRGRGHTEHADQARPSDHRFDAESLLRVQAAFSAYEVLRRGLARDSIEGSDAQATQVSAALHAALRDDAPAHVAKALRSGATAADELARASDAEAARAPFGRLSRHLIALAALDSRLTAGQHVFQCPMADGFQKWFQPSPELDNPYMGKKMPACGTASTWSEGPAEGAAPHAHAHASGEDAAIAYYTCPMHPSVRKDAQGACPICGMDLTPVTQRERETGAIVVDDARRQRIGVRTQTVQKRKMRLSIRAVGAVRYDESRLFDVNLRMSGWVQKLFVNETGQRVRSGQTLFSLYSPELYAAQLEHLASVKRADAGGAALAKLSHMSRTRLKLLGMSSAQIEALEQKGEAREGVPIVSPAGGYVIDKQIVQGARVEAGTRAYRIADLSRVWIDAEVYESDLPHVRVGQRAQVELPYVEGARIDAQVDYVYPALDEQTRAGRVRVELPNQQLSLKPDMYANVFVEVDLGERLAIPDSAVIYTGPRRVVFVDLGEGKLMPRQVSLGAHADGLYEVKKGLSAGDVVVTSGNFLIAAESRLRSAASYWEDVPDQAEPPARTSPAAEAPGGAP